MRTTPLPSADRRAPRRRLPGCALLVIGGSPSLVFLSGYLGLRGIQGSADTGRELLIGRDEGGPPLLNVVGLTPVEVRGQVLGVDLPPRPIGEGLVKRHAPDLDDQDGLLAVSGQRGLSDLVERLRAPAFPVGRPC